MTIPAGDDATVTTDTMTITQVARTNIPIKGEVAKQLMNTGQYGTVLEQLFAQHIRAIVNTIESYAGTVIKNGSSRATGTAGTTPFASTISSTAQLRKILVDNGCPMDGQVSLVVDTAAGANLRSLTQLQKVNEAGTAGTLRNGELLNLNGLSIKESAGVATHTIGTLAGSPTITNANFAVGSTSLTLSSAGTGTIVAGDALSIANDTGNVYIVKTGDSDVSDGGTLVLNKPGLRKATGASTRALTIAAAYTGNAAFHRSAVEVVMRPPAMPVGGDAAVDRMTVFDEKSGLSFEVALYLGYGMNMLEFVTYYDVKVWKPEFVATLLG
jgi:hypothetical protein